MITFYRAQDCPGCRAIEEALDALTLAHDTVVVPPGSTVAPHGSKPPVLDENGEVVEGRDRILEHLEHLQDFKALWQKFQSDACYCDDEGNIE